MRCYFWGTNNLSVRDKRGRGVASFTIPDWGVQFRTAHEGTASECEYAALLALLRFVENNPRVFEGKKLEVFSDAVALVQKVNRRVPPEPAEAKSLALVRVFRNRIPFELAWVPPEQNCAIRGVLDLAPLNTKTPIQYTTIDRGKTVDKPTSGDLPTG